VNGNCVSQSEAFRGHCGVYESVTGGRSVEELVLVLFALP
jgi:hypothetical protein